MLPLFIGLYTSHGERHRLFPRAWASRFEHLKARGFLSEDLRQPILYLVMIATSWRHVVSNWIASGGPACGSSQPSRTTICVPRGVRGSPEPGILAPGDEPSVLMRELGTDRYRIATPSNSCFSLTRALRCVSVHNWGSFRAEGNAVGGSAITARVLIRDVFFRPARRTIALTTIQARRNHVCLLLESKNICVAAAVCSGLDAGPRPLPCHAG